jgi:hypothetical protein
LTVYRSCRLTSQETGTGGSNSLRSASESLRTGTATRADCPKTFQPISPIEIRQREHAEPDDLPDDVHVRE